MRSAGRRSQLWFITVSPATIPVVYANVDPESEYAMRVYVHGNCQAPAIASLLAEQFPDWEIASYEVFTQKIIDEIDRYHECVRNADIIISQPIHNGYREREDLSLDWVRAERRTAAPLIVFPSMFFDGQLVGWRSVPIPGYGMPYQDMLTLHCAAIGMGTDRIAGIVMDDDLYPDWFIDQEITLSIAETRRRESDDKIDVLLSPFLEEFGTTTPLFHVTNHPYRQALVYVANSILSNLGLNSAISATGPECLRFPHIPLATPVRRFLRKSGAANQDWEIADAERYHLPLGVHARLDYCARVVAHLKTYPRAKLMACLQQPHVQPFLQRLAAAVPGLPHIEMWRANDGR